VALTEPERPTDTPGPGDTADRDTAGEEAATDEETAAGEEAATDEEAPAGEETAGEAATPQVLQ
jgi:hypothetical protein